MFIHGFLSGTETAWSESGDITKSWLTWLCEDCTQARVWTLDWESDAPSFIDLAAHSLAALEAESLGTRPIIFVTHSAGGILVKQLLRHAVDLLTPNGPRIATSTRIVVFVAVPHAGSHIANWLNWAADLVGPFPIARQLKSGDFNLDNLDAWYRAQSGMRDWETHAFCEQLKTCGVMFVPRQSADPKIPGVAPLVLRANHFGVCKPRSRNDTLYKIMLSILRRLVKPKSAHLLSEGPPIIDDFAGRQSALDMYGQALRATNSAVILGPSGIGKTWMAAAVVQALPVTKCLWVTFRPSLLDKVEHVFSELAYQLELDGSADVLQALRQVPRMSVDVLLRYLRTALGRKAYCLVFDNVQVIRDKPVVQSLLEELTRDLPTSTKVIFAGLSVPHRLYQIETKPLQPLDDSDLVALLRKRRLRLTPEARALLLVKTHGRPKLIDMVLGTLGQTESGGDTTTIEKIPENPDSDQYIAEQLLKHYGRRERDVVRLLALVRRPVSAEVVLLCLPGKLTENALMHLVEDKSVLAHGGPLYAVHDIISGYVARSLDVSTTHRLHIALGNSLLQDESFLEAAYHTLQANDPVKSAQVLVDHIGFMIQDGHAVQCLMLLNDAEAQAPELSIDPYLLAAKAKASRMCGQLREACEYFKNAEHVLHTTRDHALSSTLCDFAEAKRMLGEYAEAHAIYQRALAASLEQGQSIEAARSYCGLGRVERLTGLYKQAVGHYEKSSSIPADSQPLWLRAEAAFGLARTVMKLGRHLEALRLYKEALVLASQARDSYRAAEATWGRAEAYVSIGRLEEARLDFERVITTAKSLGSPPYAMTWGYLGLAMVSYAQGMDEAAIRILQDARELAQETGDQYGLIVADLRQAETHRKQGDLDAARRHALQAKDLSERCSHPLESLHASFLGVALSNMAVEEKDAVIDKLVFDYEQLVVPWGVIYCKLYQCSVHNSSWPRLEAELMRIRDLVDLDNWPIEQGIFEKMVTGENTGNRLQLLFP